MESALINWPGIAYVMSIEIGSIYGLNMWILQVWIEEQQKFSMLIRLLSLYLKLNLFIHTLFVTIIPLEHVVMYN